MSTDQPVSDDSQTPEEALQASTPAAPDDAPVSAPGSDDLPELTLGGDAPAGETEPAAPVIIRGKLDRFGTALGTGRRKTSVARVRIQDGSGRFLVNGRDFLDFFRVERDRNMVQAPLLVTDSRHSVDISVRVEGGGTTGQTGAVLLGIARALEARNPAFHSILAHHGFLTRDDRMVERKKYGRRKARRSFQFSKR